MSEDTGVDRWLLNSQRPFFLIMFLRQLTFSNNKIFYDYQSNKVCFIISELNTMAIFAP